VTGVNPARGLAGKPENASVESPGPANGAGTAEECRSAKKGSWQIYFGALLNSTSNSSSASIAARRCSSNGILRSSDLVGRRGKATRSCNARISRSRMPGVFQAHPDFRPHGNFFPSAFICAIHRARPSDRAANTRALPSGVFAPVDKPPCKRQRFLPLTGHLRQQASWPWSLAPQRCLSLFRGSGLPRNLCLFPVALTPLFFRHSSWMSATGTR
jgi:hypothetical protein